MQGVQLCAGGVLLAVMAFVIVGVLGAKDRCGCPVGEARAALNIVRSAVRVYRQAHPNGPCPTFEQLKAEKDLDRAFVPKDPWGGTYQLVKCDDEDIAGFSSGPDRRVGTEDDICAGPSCQARGASSCCGVKSVGISPQSIR